MITWFTFSMCDFAIILSLFSNFWNKDKLEDMDVSLRHFILDCYPCPLYTAKLQTYSKLAQFVHFSCTIWDILWPSAVGFVSFFFISSQIFKRACFESIQKLFSALCIVYVVWNYKIYIFFSFGNLGFEMRLLLGH